MASQTSQVNRPLVGVVSLACFTGAAVVWWQFDDRPWSTAAVGSLTRIGLVMAALWLALPGRFGAIAGAKLSPKVFMFVLAGVALVAARPRTLLFMLPLLAVLGFFALVIRPRSTQR